MKDKRSIIALALLLTGSVFGQEQRKITITEAISMSVRNSNQLKMSTARIDEAAAALKEAEQRKLPDASVTAGYMRLSSANVDFKKQSSSGGGSGSSTPTIDQAAYGLVNASLPIYSGGRIRYGIESARYLAEAAKLDAEHDREAVIQNTVEAFVNLYKAKAAVDLVQENLIGARERVREYQSQERNGLLPRNELLKAELQASNTELSLLDVQNNWQFANVNMNIMLGLPESTQLLPDSTSLTAVANQRPLEEFLQTALANRKDLAASERRRLASLTGEKAVKGEKLPSLAVTGGYVAAYVPNVVTITNAMNIGLGLSYNIGSLWKNKAKLQSAEARTREVAAGEAALADQIRLQVNRTYLDWLSSQKKIDVYAKAIEQSSENYRIIKNKYANSLATTADVLEADVAQLQARMNFIFAKADAIVVYNRLLQASGQQINQ